MPTKRLNRTILSVIMARWRYGLVLDQAIWEMSDTVIGRL